MLKRIKPEHVRLGMFIEEVEGDWQGQKFWQHRFLLDREEDVVAIKTSNAAFVVINLAIGRRENAASSKRPTSRVSEKQLRQALQTVDKTKPLIKAIFTEARISNCISPATALRVVDDVANCMRENSGAMIAVTRLKTKDEYTFLHSIAVTALMVHLGRAMKLEDSIIRVMAMGGLLHDVGKMKLPIAVLNKAGPLTSVEIALVRQHPQFSHEIVAGQDDMPQTVSEICLNHHERLDGKGYPNGLYADGISGPVRIASICDVFDALTSHRPYKKAWSTREAADFMAQQHGQFDQQILKTFFSALKI